LPLVFAEIDLVFLTPEDEIALVEVKSVNERDLIFGSPVKSKQRLRLRKALIRWGEAIDRPVRLHLAAVNHSAEVITFFDFLSS
jgi:Holliday junction resolvase-like predicted endonuclease